MKEIPKLQTAFLPLIYNRELNMATNLPIDRTYNVRFPYNINVTKKRTHFASKSPRTSRRALNVLPYYINAGDLVTAAIGPLNVASPGQHIGAIRDANLQRKDKNTTWGGNYFRSLMRGNSGWVTPEYAEEHPLVSLAWNVGGDALTLGGPKAILYLTKMDMPRYGFTSTTDYYFKPGYLGVNSSPIGKVPEVPEGYTFIKEVELSGRNGKRKVHLVKDNSTGKTKILEDITFKSDLDWSKNWFEAAGRKYKDGSLTEYNDKDIKRLESHIPEYIEIEKKAKADGTWLKMPDGSTWEGDPRSWVLYKSEAVQKQNPEIFATGIHKEIDPNYNEQLWGLPFINQSKLALARARTYVDKDSKVFPMFTKKLNTEQSYTFDAKGSYWQAIKDKNGGYKTTDDIVDQNSKKKLVKIDNVIDVGDHKVPVDSKYYYEGIGNNELIPLNDIIILPNVFRKSLIGNNGDFKHPTNMFRGLIPLSILGSGYSMSNE